MSDGTVYSRPELARMRAWNVCLNDARRYIALAREIRGFIQPDQVFKYNGGTGSVCGTVEKGLLSAAVVSAGQLLGSGRESKEVASNWSPNLINLRNKLYQESDFRNGWEAGKSEVIFAEQVKKIRDGFLAHYDGSVSNYIEIMDESDGSLLTTWMPPNPYLSVETFAELEQALYQMECALRAIFFPQLRIEPTSGSAS